MTGVPASAAGGSSGARSAPDQAADGAPEVSGSAAALEARHPRGGKLAAAAVNQASVWNVANLLTMVRLVLVPGFVALLLPTAATTRPGARSPGRPSPSP